MYCSQIILLLVVYQAEVTFQINHPLLNVTSSEDVPGLDNVCQWLVAGFLRHLLFIDHVLLRRGQRGGVFAPDVQQPGRNAGLGRIRELFLVLESGAGAEERGRVVSEDRGPGPLLLCQYPSRPGPGTLVRVATLQTEWNIQIQGFYMYICSPKSYQFLLSIFKKTQIEKKKDL